MRLRTISVMLIVCLLICNSGCENVSEHKEIYSRSVIYDQQEESEEPLQIKTVSFCGEEYTGEFAWDLERSFFSYIIDTYFYIPEESDEYVTFQVRRDNGELKGISFVTKNKEKAQEDLPDAERTAEEVAREYAQMYTDLEGYQLQISSRQRTSGDVYLRTEYTFDFRRYIHELRTTDYISVTVSAEGKLCSIFIGDLGALDNISKAEIESFADVDIHTMVKKIAKGEVTEVDLDASKFAISPDGRLYLAVSVEERHGSGENTYETREVYVIL